MADRQTGQVLVGQAACDFEQVLPELFFRVGIDQHVLRRIVHAAQVTGMARIAAAPLTWCRFEQHHAGTGFTGHEGRTQGRVAAANHQNIHRHRYFQGTLPELDQNWYLRKPPSTGITAPVM